MYAMRTEVSLTLAAPSWWRRSVCFGPRSPSASEGLPPAPTGHPRVSTAFVSSLLGGRDRQTRGLRVESRRLKGDQITEFKLLRRWVFCEGYVPDGEQFEIRSERDGSYWCSGIRSVLKHKHSLPRAQRQGPKVTPKEYITLRTARRRSKDIGQADPPASVS